MSLLSLVVVNLILSYARSQTLPRHLRERFTMGFWHLEPIVLAMNGLLLIGVSVYAFFNAISSILRGGRELAFGIGIIYAAITLMVCVAVAAIAIRANRRIRSDFIRLDIHSWVMSAGITAALLVAFSLGLAVRGTEWGWTLPYIDPVVLALICLIMIPLPVAGVRQALSDILLVAPVDLKQHVDEVCSDFVETHGFLSYHAYVAKIGRAREIEICFIVPPGGQPRPLAEWDSFRTEVAIAIGRRDPHRWLTILFTEDPAWA